MRSRSIQSRLSSPPPPHPVPPGSTSPPAPCKTKLPEVNVFFPLPLSIFFFFLLNTKNIPASLLRSIFIILFIVYAVQLIRDSPQTPLSAESFSGRGRGRRAAGRVTGIARIPGRISLCSAAAISSLVLLLMALLGFCCSNLLVPFLLFVLLLLLILLLSLSLSLSSFFSHFSLSSSFESVRDRFIGPL